MLMQATNMKVISVRNLPATMTEQGLGQCLAAFGKIVDVKIVFDNQPSQRPRVVGFIYLDHIHEDVSKEPIEVEGSILEIRKADGVFGNPLSQKDVSLISDVSFLIFACI